MKSICTENTIPNKPEYPCLKKSKLTGTIVLFVQKDIGTVIYLPENSTIHFLGKFSDLWDSDGFEPYNGSVTLSNE